MPFLVAGSVNYFSVLERLMVIEPIEYSIVLLLIEFHVDGLQRLYIEDIVPIIQRRLFIVKGWESHSLEMPSISLLPPHHDPHSSPLSGVDRFYDLWDLVNKSDCPCDMIENLDVSNLLPRHGYILEKFENSMWNEFKGS